MSDSADKLTSKQHKGIAALMSSPTIATAAAAIGIEERSIYRWLNEPHFAEAYRVARREATAQAVARLQQYSGAAVQVLVDLMEKESTHASVRLAAASKVLDLAIRAVEIEDMAERLAALEAAYAAKL